MERIITVGILKETMVGEKRIPILPKTVSDLIRDLRPMEVKANFVVETGLGESIGISNREWRAAGALVQNTRAGVYGAANIILGVKQPFMESVTRFQPGQGICCFHHVWTNRNVVEKLLKKGVKILPFEANVASRIAMSTAVGSRMVDILDRCSTRGWLDKKILVIGARGVVGRHCIDHLLRSGVRMEDVYCCDITAGEFSTIDTIDRRTFLTFSSMDEDSFGSALEVCPIVIIAALSNRGRAPKFIRDEHLRRMPNPTLIVQVNIDEGGSIDREEFCMPTYWGYPVYNVILGSKVFRVCNVPDIPGCIRADESSVDLALANYGYYCDIFSRWPDVPAELLFTGFDDRSA